MTKVDAEFEARRMALSNLPIASREVIGLQLGAPINSLFLLPELAKVCANYCADEDPVLAAVRVIQQASLAYTAGADDLDFDEAFAQSRKGLLSVPRT